MNGKTQKAQHRYRGPLTPSQSYNWWNENRRTSGQELSLGKQKRRKNELKKSYKGSSPGFWTYTNITRLPNKAKEEKLTIWEVSRIFERRERITLSTLRKKIYSQFMTRANTRWMRWSIFRKSTKSRSVFLIIMRPRMYGHPSSISVNLCFLAIQLKLSSQIILFKALTSRRSETTHPSSWINFFMLEVYNISKCHRNKHFNLV